jgi:hypothetical protein
MQVEIEYITLPVAKEAALFYNNSDEKDKIRYQSLFSLLLKPRTKQEAIESLFTTMNEISIIAKKNGLTQEILDEILESK